MTAGVEDSVTARNRLARERAVATMEAVKPSPTTLVRYLSRGRVAVIGGMEAAEFAPRLTERLQPLVILTEGAEEPSVPQVPLGGRSLVLEGHLGDFTLRLGEPGTPGHERIRVDLVLDLQPEPLLEMPLPPTGYLAATLDEASLAWAQRQLEALVGTFEKPLYLDYQADLCAHARAGQVVCTRCIDACPAEAIRPGDESVVVDPDRCQGGGICATACPSGALRYRWPESGDALEQVKALLEGYRQAGGEDPVLVLHTEEMGDPVRELPPNHLPYEVEELASRGLEFWFGALAYGAGQVWLWSSQPLPGRVEKALERELTTARAILEALGFDPEVVTRRGGPARMPPISPAIHAPLGDKRQLFYLDLDHLHDQAERPRPMAVLEAGAPFGSASVDGERCTLCKACVGACPGNALQDVADEPAIRFLEANCLQCGTCTRLCPEDAISISPRLLLDPEQRNRVRTLHREEPFLCVSCSKPFATHSVVLRMQKALRGHWMFSDEAARRRLQMCDHCRVVDIARDPEAMARAGGLGMDH